MPMHTIRTFFAIELPTLTLEQIAKELYDLKNSIPKNIKWVPIDSMHITIKFIGEFNPKYQSSIQKDLQSHLIGLGEIKLSFGKIGVFPNLRNPRVVWLGLNVPRQLIKLARIVNLVTHNYGFPQEKRNFSPHLTIGRIRNNVSSSERELIGQMIANYRFKEIEPFSTNRVSFIKSSLTPKGPVYSTLFEIPL
jgi:2'-5' RNA ligase